MYRPWVYLLVGGLCVGIVPAMAATPCGAIASAQDIVICAVARHPDVQLAQSTAERDATLPAAARQLPNPELQTTVLSGQPGAPDGTFYEIDLAQPIELGGKRKGRIQQARATAQAAQAQVLASQESTVLNTVLALYRLRQIRNELAAVNETVATYRHLVGNYASRPKLAPEQEVSASVFDFAKDEATLQRAVLLQEQTSLLQWLAVATGLEEQTLLRHLPKGAPRWPTLTPDNTPTRNAALAQADAERALSEANLKIAKGQAWPDLKIGPSVQTQTQIGGSNTAAGVNVGITLPVWNHNRNGIAYAQRDHAHNALSQQLARQKQQADRTGYVTRYQQSLKALRQLKSAGAVHASHQNVEKYFSEGLISASLVIESHRQMLDVLRARNSHELAALEALWRLHILDGTVLEASL